MAPLYRRDVAAPPFGCGTFWAQDPGSVEWLSEWETRSRPAPDSRVYRAEVVIEDDTEVTVEQVQKFSSGTVQPHELLEWIKVHVAPGYRWVKFTEVDRPWHDVILYLGDEQIAAEPWEAD